MSRGSCQNTWRHHYNVLQLGMSTFYAVFPLSQIWFLHCFDRSSFESILLLFIDFFTAGDKITSTSADTSTTNTGFSRQLPKVIFNFPLVSIYEHILKWTHKMWSDFFPPRGLVGFHDTSSRRSWEASTFCCSCCSDFIIQTVLKNIIGPNYIFQA